MELDEELSILSSRRSAYADDEYELQEDEGFTCTECDWRGLSAPMADSWGDGEDFVKCPDCDTQTLEASDEELDLEAVRERVPDEYL